MSDVLNVLLLAALGSILALSGGVIFLFSKRWSGILAKYSVPFAAGVLLTVSLVGLLPESVHALGEQAFVVTLVSFLVAYVFEHFIFDIHHHEGHTHASLEKSIPLVIIGDTIHNFIDGVAIAATYLVSPGLGVITAVSTFLHEVPHEIGDFGILLKAGWKKMSIFRVNLLSASTTFFGAGFVLFISRDQTVIGYLLAIAAGLFLYLGASDFLPHIHEGKEHGKSNVIALFLGFLIMLTIFSVVPHSHEETSHVGYEEHGEEHVQDNKEEDSDSVYEVEHTNDSHEEPDNTDH